VPDLEAEMAKALEGNFFWEHTATPGVFCPPEMREIIVAQRALAAPKKKTQKEMEQEREERLNKIIEHEKRKEASRCKVNHIFKNDVEKFVARLASVIAEVHGVPLEEITSKSRGTGSNPVKHHLPWAFVRYYPGLTTTVTARYLNKDRSAVNHSCDRFDEMLDLYRDRVAAVDEIMGYTG
jgi:hypothetical protein